jgi:hypothetical protein
MWCRSTGEQRYMKDSIILQGRTYECTKLVQQRFGVDDQTLRRWMTRLIPLSQVRQHLGLAGEI